MTSAERDMVLAKATVPEHSVLFMEALSGGEAFLKGPYLFITAADRLLGIGYRLDPAEDPRAFEDALAKAIQQARPKNVSVICPALPKFFKTYRQNQDGYYVLPADAPVPPRLNHFADRAASVLEVESGTKFTPAHRHLWAEFMGRKPLPADVAHLFRRTASVIAKTPDLMLLNGWDKEGHLAACLLVDQAPRQFASYLLGAHSRTHYTPYATDLLFRTMLETARKDQKAYLHLGLGVDEGIRRFKTKWGATAGLNYEMACWQEKRSFWPGAGDVARMLATPQALPVSKRKYLAVMPPQRTMAMLWSVEKDGCRSYVGGTAHFFRFSFAHFLRSLFETVDTVIFEGPLDTVSLGQVAAMGRRLEDKSDRVIDFLTEDQLSDLTRVVCGPAGFWARFNPSPGIKPPEVVNLLTNARPWLAFFSLWSGYLARLGWDQSVDLEAWQLAHDMGKAACGMETIYEQVKTLDDIPLESIVDFLRRCRQWRSFSRLYEKAYLNGDVDRILNEIRMFPTRTGNVIFHRDAIFVERMRPHLEKGPCAVFMGVAHLPNVCRMLGEAGYEVRRYK